MPDHTATSPDLTVTVTSSDEVQNTGLCLWCSAPVERSHTKGPAPSYCSQAHRQRAFEARQATVAMAYKDAYEKAQLAAAQMLIKPFVQEHWTELEPLLNALGIEQATEEGAA